MKHTLTLLIALLPALPFVSQADEGEIARSLLPAPDKPEPLERIGIRPGEMEAQFVLKGSKAPFFVTGFNYIRLRAAEGASGGDHSTFDADTKNSKACYDANRAEAMFSALSKGGYNTVRVFIIGRSQVNPGIAGDYDTTKALHEPYMENVLDFLRRATRHRIRVLPSFGDGELPFNAYYRDRVQGKGHNKNVTVLTTEGVAARVEHITSFLLYIKSKEPTLLPTLLGLQCQNEACLHADQWPFSEKSGVFKAANGKSYDLSKTADRQAIMDEGYQHYHERIVAAVKAVDSEMLVAEGVFVPRAVGMDLIQHAGVWPGKKGDERYPPTLTTLGKGKLDFLDVHFYRTSANEPVAQAFRLNLGSTGFFTPEMAEARKAKPVIMGEFGAFDFVEKTFEEAVQSMAQVRDLALKERVNGMLYWTYDCFEQPSLHHAGKDWTLFVRTMRNFEENTDIRPGQPWLDTQGELINAHGFCILHHENTYYWYGSHKIPGRTEDDKNEAGVRCYVSDDLLSWRNAGLVLDVSSPGMHAEVRDAFILDRPKLIYHAATKRFILYFKLYPPKEQGGKTGKDLAYVGVATAATPTGAFEYQGKFLGGGSATGSGDFAIFQDTDGAAYHIAVRKPDETRKDKPLVCGRLSADGLKPAGGYVVMEGVANATEAPALFRRAGKYYLLGSGSTGWAPNAARMFVADHLTGPYQSLGNPCRGVNPHNHLGPEKTFGGQSTYVFPVPGKTDKWIAMFDLNQPKDPVNSGYLWLPLEFDGDNQPTITWKP